MTGSMRDQFAIAAADRTFALNLYIKLDETNVFSFG
jgi:hypothetical protein